MGNDELLKQIAKLQEVTGCGKMQCKKALDYSKGNIDLAVAYLKAKNLAVATPNLTFDERVQRFLRK